jgi:hypothetical protein
MDIDWPRTAVAAGTALAVLSASAAADAADARAAGEPTAGPAPILGGLAGIVLALAAANL